MVLAGLSDPVESPMPLGRDVAGEAQKVKWLPYKFWLTLRVLVSPGRRMLLRAIQMRAVVGARVGLRWLKQEERTGKISCAWWEDMVWLWVVYWLTYCCLELSVLTLEYVFVSDGNACWGGLWNIYGLNQSISSDWVFSFRKSLSVVPLTLVTDWSWCGCSEPGWLGGGCNYLCFLLCSPPCWVGGGCPPGCCGVTSVLRMMENCHCVLGCQLGTFCTPFETKHLA